MQEDWIARWRDGRIAFHEGQPNAFLDRYLARLAGARRVLVAYGPAVLAAVLALAGCALVVVGALGV